MSERDIPSLLQDILEAIGNIKDFTRGMTFEMYLVDLKTKHAVERKQLFSINIIKPVKKEQKEFDAVRFMKERRTKEGLCRLLCQENHRLQLDLSFYQS